jgi:hypothetical protein
MIHFLKQAAPLQGKLALELAALAARIRANAA